MLINFFKSSFFNQYIFIFLAGMLMWAGAWIVPPAMPLPEGPVPLYELTYQLVHALPRLSTLLAFILVLGVSWIYNEIFSHHEMVLKNSSLSALLLLMFLSMIPAYLTLSPVNISVALLTVVLYHLMVFYHKPEHIDRVYMAGFFISLAGFFYFPMFVWFFFLLISLIVCRAASLRVWLAAFTGFLTPLLYYAVWCYWHDHLADTLEQYAGFVTSLNLKPLDLLTGLPFIFFTSAAAIFWIWAMMYPLKGMDKGIDFRAKSSLMLWTILFTLISFPFSDSLLTHHSMLAMPAFALFISRTVFGLRKMRLAASLMLIYFLAIVIHNLYFGLLEYLT